MTAVEWLQSQIVFESVDKELLARWDEDSDLSEFFEQAKEMEKEQMLNALNISAKEAYRAGQKTMYCGCYDIEDATTFEEWIIKYKLNK